MTTKLLHKAPPRLHIVSIRFTEPEIRLINRLIEITGSSGSDLIRHGAMQFIHQSLRSLDSGGDA